MAPEIVKKDNNGMPTDIWALGVMLFIMLTGTYPFKAGNDKELYKQIVIGNYSIPDSVSPLAKELIKKLLNPEPIRRPTAA